jgi:hypothetical protein
MYPAGQASHAKLLEKLYCPATQSVHAETNPLSVDWLVPGGHGKGMEALAGQKCPMNINVGNNEENTLDAIMAERIPIRRIPSKSAINCYSCCVRTTLPNWTFKAHSMAFLSIFIRLTFYLTFSIHASVICSTNCA